MRRIIKIIIGIVLIILGLIGLVLPVVPQIPFLLLGMGFLVSGSDKLKKKLISSNIYIKHIKDRVERSNKLKIIWDKLIN